MKTQPLVRDSDRFAAATLAVDRLYRWTVTRTVQRRAHTEGEALWIVHVSSNGGIYTEAAALFPGPRSAWVR